MRQGKSTLSGKASVTFAGALFACALLAGGLSGEVAPLAAQSDSLSMLRNVAKGQWTVKYRDGRPDRKVCIKSGLELIQLQHTKAGCSRFVVEDAAAKVAVQYTCPGDGYGRTNIRKETSSLVQIESQGIASGLPFQFIAEARKTGSC